MGQKQSKKIDYKVSKSYKKGNEEDSIKIPITLNNIQLKEIRKSKGIMGLKDASIIKNIIIDWLRKEKK